MGSNGTDGYTAPYAALSSTDRGGALLVVDIVGLVIAVFSVGLRVKLANRETASGLGFLLFKDDMLCFLGMLFCIIEFALVWAGVKRGTGKDIDLIPPNSLVKVQQIQYAIDLFYIFALYISRLSVLMLFQRLQSANKNLVWYISFGVLSAWAVACIFVVAIKCDLKHPWIEYNSQCTGLVARYEAIDISSIAMEAGIFALGSYLTYIVQMPLAGKLQMLGLFTTRAMVVIFLGLRLAHLSGWFHSSNPTYTGIPAQIYGLTAVYASLVTATTPLLKSFMFRFRVLAAKPTVVSFQTPKDTYATATNTRPEPNETESKRNKFKNSEKGRRAGKKRVLENSLAEYEQWLPSETAVKRHDSHCGDTDATAKTDDDRSDKTLNREKDRNKEEHEADIIESV